MKTKELAQFSVFKGPITNVSPSGLVTIPDIYKVITGGFFRKKTMALRALDDREKYRKVKKKLPFVTFSGNFDWRAKEALHKHSGLICIDVDHLEDTPTLNKYKELMINDQLLETALVFTSPSGKGLKWIIEVDLAICPDHETNYRGIVNYLNYTHPDLALYLDRSGKDVSRACFLSWDPFAYINPKYLKDEQV